MTNAPVPQSPQNQPAESPMMGLFLDRPAHMIDPKGLSACNNVRIELGRVRSDLIGWSALTNTGTLTFNGPIIWMDALVNDVHSQILAVTPTDIFELLFMPPSSYSLVYVTPTYITGLASVNNGSTSVAGTAGTHWAGDITGGSQPFNLSAAASVGATSLSVNVSFANEYLLNVLPGMPVQDLTSSGSIPAGTYITSVTESVGSCTLGISQAVQIAIPTGDTLFLGSGQSVRANVRAGDQIAFGTTNANAPGLTWYTVASVSLDGTLTNSGTSTLILTTPYTGANLSSVSYVIRECLTDTTKLSPPYLPECSSDNLQFPAGFTGTSNPCNVAWFFTNGVDPVYVFFNDIQGGGGQNAVMYARSIPFTCACLKQVRGIMIYGGLSFGGGIVNAGGTTLGSSIASSDDNLPLQLNSGIAFQGIATSGPFTISRMAILGATLLLYSSGTYSGGTIADNDKAGSVTSATLVGFPTVWSFSDVIQTRGPSSGGSVAIFADHHEFLSIDGQYRYNGLFIQVMNDHIWRTVMKNFDFTRRSAAFAAIIPTFGDVIWVIPQLTDPVNQLYASTAYVEHYMEQANSYLFKPHTKKDFPFTAISSLQNVNLSFPADISSQPLYIVGDFNGNVWQLYNSNLQNSTPPLCTATWASRKIGNGRARMLVTRVYPELEYQASPVSTVDVTLTLQNYAAGPVTITDTQDFDLSYGGGVGWTTHFRRGAVASVTLSDQAGVGWICDGYDWDYTAGGVRLKA